MEIYMDIVLVIIHELSILPININIYINVIMLLCYILEFNNNNKYYKYIYFTPSYGESFGP